MSDSNVKKSKRARRVSVSLKDIAEASGFSVQTVSHILGKRDGKGYKEATCDHVRQVARKMGYRVNGLARAMRDNRTGQIGLLLDQNLSRSPLPATVLQRLMRELQARDCNLIVGQLDEEKLQDSGALPRILEEQLTDGVLVNWHVNPTEAFRETIKHFKIPAIWMNFAQEADCIYPDDFRGGVDATRILLERGHKRIAYVDLSHAWSYRDRWHYSAMARAGGYAQAMKEASLKPEFYLPDTLIEVIERPAILAKLLREKTDIEAVVTYSAQTALDLVILNKEQRSRPIEQLWVSSFAGVGDYYFADQVALMLLPYGEQCRRAVDMLFNKIQSPNSALPPMPIAFDVRFPGHLTQKKVGQAVSTESPKTAARDLAEVFKSHRLPLAKA